MLVLGDLYAVNVWTCWKHRTPRFACRVGIGIETKSAVLVSQLQK